MPKTNLHQQIFIEALPTKVWKVLTCCDYVNQYLLDGRVHCEWTEGSAISLIHQKEEKEQIIDKGRILKVVPGLLLSYHLQEVRNKSFVSMTYELMPAEDCVELKLYSTGFSDSDEDFLFRIKETRLLLQKIKWLAEYS